MYKRILKTFICLSLFSLFCVQSTFALSTYVGVKIVDLKDAPSNSCIGVGGYGDQGRIRGFVSNPDDGYPIYYKLYKLSDGTVIREGDSVIDIDYEKGDTMLLPWVAELTPGEEYGLFFDVDAYKIYLPLQDYGTSFKATSNNTYWITGKTIKQEYERYAHSDNNLCTYNSVSNSYFYDSSCSQYAGMPVFNNRSNFNSGCVNDDSDYNCVNEGIMFVAFGRSGFQCGSHYIKNFRMDTSLVNLYTDTVGNFEFTFVFN